MVSAMPQCKYMSCLIVAAVVVVVTVAVVLWSPLKVMGMACRDSAYPSKL